ncbi:hypothetical protein SPRG_14680 [Saprolegnia parasitica CBS 223.65]|uniref:Uncharacterized protein n=1 Tax=Saprolegnia parasitica (strain CBS 223.65) TaxID=695850 RepID=A0A067BNK7_SAPPC|nr:hypothetical protein SPRG_14680 [Saprolegnia parasitica CBS 223.65]KDO19818.1 hypothetical protein SPRG_14680 [Saprolegnia parasitica CBS 223.65]|eukprot:XP_012209477.1 hypothetical protein SPRG_14680 [Saprolegnia parasitica CBS 223.65]
MPLATFYLPYCGHDDLFASSYVRCQKSSGHKILRCFPHCCPRHVHYRNCGSAVRLAIASSIEARAFAAFGLATETNVRVGDVISIDDVTIRSRESPLATHLEGTRLDENGHFEFDEKQADGWHYGWKSGRSKAQRDLLHVLWAVVLHPVDAHRWTVVAVAISTPFTIVSYRGEHNKKKKHAQSVPRRLQRLASTLPNSDVSSLGRLVRFLGDYRLDSAPRDLLLSIEARLLAMHGLHALPLLPAAAIRPAFSVPDYVTSSVVAAIALAHPHFLARVNSYLLAHADAVLNKAALNRVLDALLHRVLVPYLESELQASCGVSISDITIDADGDGYDSFTPRFVAQLREAYITTQSTLVRLELTPMGPSPMDGTWTWSSDDTSALQALPWTLPHYLRYLAIARSFTQRLVGHTLQIRATSTAFSTVPCELVLDGDIRSLRVLPSGESCMGHVAVDYVGCLVAGEELQLRLFLYERSRSACVLATVRVWPSGAHTLVYRVQLERTCLDDAGLLDVRASQRVSALGASEPHGHFLSTYSRVAEDIT